MWQYKIGKDFAELRQKVSELEEQISLLKEGSQSFASRRQIERVNNSFMLPGYVGVPVGLNSNNEHIWTETVNELMPLNFSARALCDIPLRYTGRGEGIARGGICHLGIESPVSFSVCTGSLISRRCVLTAAHCLYKDGRYCSTVHVSPGQYITGGIQRPFGVHSGNLVRVPEEWRLREDIRYDFGVIILDNDNAFNRTNFYWGLEAAWDPISVTGVYGYPAEGDGILVGQIYFAPDVDAYVDADFIWYKATTYGGMSGGPIFLGGTHPTNTIRGVHHGGNCPNFAVRITENRLRTIFGWIDQYG